MRRQFRLWTGVLLLASSAALAGACAEETTAAAQSQAPAANPDQVVAEVAGKPITLKDVDARWEAFDAAERARIVQAMYQNRRNMIELLIGDQLIANAAKATGQSVEAFIAADGAKRLPAIAEADVAQFYEQNKDRAQGRTLDQLRGEIKPFLEERRRQQARAMLVEELKGKEGANWKVMLDPPRYTVPTTKDDPVRGNPAAPITIVEFSDYQCPYCQRVEPTLKRLRAVYGDKLRIVWKDFPLTQIHPQAAKAGEAAHCAGDQSKYWELHDVLFTKQQQLQPDDLKRHALELGLDTAKFNQCLDSAKYGERVSEGVAEGGALGVNSTPTIFINGRRLSGAQPYEVFAAVIDEELARTK